MFRKESRNLKWWSRDHPFDSTYTYHSRPVYQIWIVWLDKFRS